MGRKSAEKAAETQNSTRLRLMIVDDGKLVEPPLMDALNERGFRVEVVADADYALTDTRGQRYDAIIINGDFAKVDALWLCLALRVQGCLSVIVVVSKAPSAKDELEAFRAGATDRVGQSLSREMLVERILAHIAGARIKVTGLLYPVTAELPTAAGVFTMSLVPTLVSVDNRRIGFTPLEERLFARLWTGRGAIVPPEELIASAWLGRHVSMPTLQVHLHQLRRKLGKLGLAIQHVAGRGYRFSSFAPANPRKSKESVRPRT